MVVNIVTQKQTNLDGYEQIINTLFLTNDLLLIKRY